MEINEKKLLYNESLANIGNAIKPVTQKNCKLTIVQSANLPPVTYMFHCLVI